MNRQPIVTRDAPQSMPRSADIRSKAKRGGKSTSARPAWRAIGFGLAGLVGFLVFALQNLRNVRVRFLSLDGQLPLAILLLLVAVLGALIVLALGAARSIQLRIEARRSRSQD